MVKLIITKTIDNRGGRTDWKRAYNSMVTSWNKLVTARPICKAVHASTYSTVSFSCGLEFDSLLAKTKSSAIEQGTKQ